MTVTIRKPIVVFIGAAMAMVAVTAAPAHATGEGEGFGKYALNRHLAQYWAEKHAQEKTSQQKSDDQFAASESPIVSDADSSTGRSRVVIETEILDDPQHYRGR